MTLAFLGALVGSLARPRGGKLPDRFGGTRITIGAFTAMGLGILCVVRHHHDRFTSQLLDLPRTPFTRTTRAEFLIF